MPLDCYPQLNETQQAIRDTARKIVERELRPHVEAMEHQRELPYPHITRAPASRLHGRRGRAHRRHRRGLARWKLRRA